MWTGAVADGGVQVGSGTQTLEMKVAEASDRLSYWLGMSAVFIILPQAHDRL